jgi:4-alpha-glucanotransferase
VDTGLVEKLARLRGIGDAYRDYRGELQHFSLETKTGILRAMGCAVEDSAALAAEIRQLESARARKFLPALVTVRGSRVGFEINVTAREFGATLLWTLKLENGERRGGAVSSADCREVWRGDVEGTWITRRHLDVPVDVPPGYHELELKIGGGSVERCLLISSPAQCFEPSSVVAGSRLWGVAVQLYTLRSEENWGIGDFRDLRSLIRWAAPQGAAFIGLNPLHAMSPAEPARCSPYSASSRHFLNVLYISVPAVPEFEECPAARARLDDPLIAERLARLRECPLVDYEGVAALKFEFLEMLHQDFNDRHLRVVSERGRSFRNFLAAGGEPLRMHARFDALDRHFNRSHGGGAGWLGWPEEYRDVNGKAATRFAAEHPAAVEFFAYLQWLAHEQLLSAQALTIEMGMPIGLYGDYAVGANPSGSETWADQASYSMSAEIGAPPDPLALRGQGWGIPPQDPATMLSQRLQGFIRMIRNNMRYYGALRLDHVMSLCRLWWVPSGFSPRDGAYVHYPLEQLLTVLALESARAHCLVVGEDLGVVPDEMRRAMPEFGLYHYKVLLFEQSDGRFRAPQEYVKRALATVTTHDMPTLLSYWEGRDIELRRLLQLYPSADIEREVVEARTRDREALLTALREQGLQPPGGFTATQPFTAELALALHLYLARSAATLVAVQIEDLLGMAEPVNVPGTYTEYPNWQRKVSQTIEAVAARQDLAAQLAAINEARRLGVPR